MYRILVHSDLERNEKMARWLNKNAGYGTHDWQAYPRFASGGEQLLVIISKKEIAEIFILTFGGKQIFEDGWS